MANITVRREKTIVTIDTISDEKRGFQSIARFPIDLDFNSVKSVGFILTFKCSITFLNLTTGVIYQTFQTSSVFNFSKPSTPKLFYEIALDCCNDAITDFNHLLKEKYAHKYNFSPMRDLQFVAKLVDDSADVEAQKMN